MANPILFGIVFVITAAIVGGMIYVVWYRSKSKSFETDRLLFAAGTLTVVAALFNVSMAYYAFGSMSAAPGHKSPGETIFQSCVQILPPLATLVLGFYFGSALPKATSDDAKDQEVDGEIKQQ